LQRFLAIGGGADVETGFGQSELIGHAEKLAVVDQEHFGLEFPSHELRKHLFQLL
jgi:hypothetical protein